jgi:two-component system sensor histidine kinase SenX3
VALSILLGVCLVGVAVTLNVSWIVLNARRFIPLIIGIPFFLLLIAGVVLNTIFLARAVRRNERQDSFLNAVTHELKTPITSIRLYLETLQRHDLEEEKRRQFYQIMLEDSERLLATVEQVLKAGEVGQRAHNQVRLEVDMLSVIQQAIDTTISRSHLAPDAIVLEDGTAGMPAVVLGNAEELQTVVLNLLNNAVKYSPQTAPIRVQLAFQKDAWIVVSVRDNGIGIAAAHLKSIFKRFYRVPARNVLRRKGTGLGLFLVRTIARQHGGDAFAESPGEGKGATVSVQLPRLLSPSPAGQRQEAL